MRQRHGCDEPDAANPDMTVASGTPVRVLSRDAVRRVDAAAVERYGIPGVVLMENAGRAVAAEAIALARTSRRTRAVIWCGPGNNGGDGYVAARHLHNAGLQVTIVAVGTPRAGSDAATNRTICERMSLPIRGPEAAPSPSGDAIALDALLGTGLDRAPEGTMAAAIAALIAAFEARMPVIAVDLPSGLDADSGAALGSAVRATCTVTFVAPKPGLLAATAIDHVGRVVVADIGVPRELVAQLATATPRHRGADAGR